MQKTPPHHPSPILGELISNLVNYTSTLVCIFMMYNDMEEEKEEEK